MKIKINEFEKLGVVGYLLKSINEQGFERPTEIQRKAIPPVLKGRDVIGGSATGSGKTLVFGAGVIKTCESGKGIQSLVLTPTRELAEQNTNALREFSRHKNLRVVSVYGGVAIGPQMERIRTADVVVGTPGRVLDHLRRGTMNLNGVRILVLDEADRMLDMGFLEDVERIINECPSNRQTLLFSATITHDVARLAERYMINPIEILVDSYVDPKKLRQVYYDVPKSMKFSLLLHLIRQEKSGLVMVFSNTRRGVDFITENLRNSDVNAVALHGGYSQDKRNRVMNQFNSGKVSILVCTDVAARGLDIQGVSHVYNYDVPKESKQYVHRIGRTARAGNEGKAITLLCEDDYENFRGVLKETEVDVEREELPHLKRVRIIQRYERRPRNPGRCDFRNNGYGMKTYNYGNCRF